MLGLLRLGIAKNAGLSQSSPALIGTRGNDAPSSPISSETAGLRESLLSAQRGPVQNETEASASVQSAGETFSRFFSCLPCDLSVALFVFVCLMCSLGSFLC